MLLHSSPGYRYGTWQITYFWAFEWQLIFNVVFFKSADCQVCLLTDNIPNLIDFHCTCFMQGSHKSKTPQVFLSKFKVILTSYNLPRACTLFTLVYVPKLKKVFECRPGDQRVGMWAWGEARKDLWLIKFLLSTCMKSTTLLWMSVSLKLAAWLHDLVSKFIPIRHRPPSSQFCSGNVLRDSTSSCHDYPPTKHTSVCTTSIWLKATFWRILSHLQRLFLWTAP